MAYSAALRAVSGDQTIARPGCKWEVCNEHAGEMTNTLHVGNCTWRAWRLPGEMVPGTFSYLTLSLRQPGPRLLYQVHPNALGFP